MRQLHAVTPNEHLKIGEFDHLQQTLDILIQLHNTVRNRPFLINEKRELELSVRGVTDPNAFFVENSTEEDLSQRKTIFEVEQQHYYKTAAQSIGFARV